MTGSGATLPQFDCDLAERLRADAHGMVRAYLETLLDELSGDALTAFYVKGSAYKPWDSIIDYVPEVSDVDMQARFVHDRDAERFLGSLELALRVAERALARFRARRANPSHIPRPQLIVLNRLEVSPGYLPSPAEAVRTLFGQSYHAASREEYANAQPEDARRFMADAEYLRLEFPEKVVDRPGHHAWQAIFRLAWRVSPAGPRLLTHLGMHPYDAWTLNRSGVVRELLARGHGSLAEAYAEFYLAGWDGFRSQFREGDAARRALQAVGRLYSEGAAVIRKGA